MKRVSLLLVTLTFLTLQSCGPEETFTFESHKLEFLASIGISNGHFTTQMPGLKVVNAEIVFCNKKLIVEKTMSGLLYSIVVGNTIEYSGPTLKKGFFIELFECNGQKVKDYIRLDTQCGPWTLKYIDDGRFAQISTRGSKANTTHSSIIKINRH